MIKLDGVLKLANYGQWDGYPTGQGITVAAFVQAYLLNDTLRAEFAERVRALRFATPDELTTIENDWKAAEDECNECAKEGRYVPRYRLDAFKPYSRDTGAGVLALINDGGVKLVQDEREFLNDGLFCEWAYCVDLDACKVDVYNGYQTPSISIPFAKFDVLAMRTLQKRIARNQAARERRAAKKVA